MSDEHLGGQDEPQLTETSNDYHKARVKTSFALGLAVGVLAVVIIVGAGVTATYILALRRFEAPTSTRVVIDPTKAGKAWFAVDSSGRGTLQGWATGEAGSGSPNGGEPAGSVGYFQVAQLDSQSGVRIEHSAPVYVTKRTAVFSGGQPYEPAKGTAADAIIGNVDDISGRDLVENHVLTIEFHVVGDRIVADTINASSETTESPLSY